MRVYNQFLMDFTIATMGLRGEHVEQLMLDVCTACRILRSGYTRGLRHAQCAGQQFAGQSLSQVSRVSRNCLQYDVIDELEYGRTVECS